MQSMMKYLVLTFAIILSSLNSKAQNNHFPKGAYMSFEEIVNKTPSKQFDLQIEKRTIGDIRMSGGNDFKLTSTDEAISTKTLKKEIWAYSFGDTLYLNGWNFSFQSWYAPLISDGEYLVVKAGLSNFVVEQKKQRKMGYYFGAFGGAIQGARLATLRFLYVINKNTGTAITVTPENMQEFLKDRNDLLTQFNNEGVKEDQQVLLKYLRLLNGNGDAR
jgi:hypothetical protein